VLKNAYLDSSVERGLFDSAVDKQKSIRKVAQALSEKLLLMLSRITAPARMSKLRTKLAQTTKTSWELKGQG
jgi:hypothetical protein